MSSKRRHRVRIQSLAAIVLSALVVVPLWPLQAEAAELTNRSLQVSSSYASEVVTHAYSFGTEGPSTIGSIGFEYCTNSPVHEVTCVAPAGLDATSGTIASEIGLNGFSVSAATTSNTFAITRIAAAEPATTSILSFSNITNPSTPNQIVYVRISVYDGADLSGTRVDRGSVVFVTEDPFAVSAYVPPYLIFCVGLTVEFDCSSSNGSLVSLGELSTEEAVAGTSQFSVSTNDQFGYNLFLDGSTMTSGNNIIPPLPSQTPSVPGQSQFGINLRANTSPLVGTEPESGFVSNGTPDPNYDAPNQFRYVDGDRVALSNKSTNFNRYTVTYMVNVSDRQPAGQYAATFTYMAIASF